MLMGGSMNKFRTVPGKSELSILLVIILLFAGVFAFTKFVRSSSDQVSTVLTERDFADDPDLLAFPGGGIVATFLEPPSAIGEKNDTGAIGIDVIPYGYTETMEQTYCWDDDNEFSQHTMTLFDSEGGEVFTVEAGGSCVTRIVRKGEYEMHIRHDGKSDERVAVFIVPGEDKSVINTASDEALENLTTILNVNKCISCDLRGINLNGLDLTGIDLSYSILDNAILVDTILVDANLSGASLKNADLSRANLKGANLSGADLTNAILINSDLSNADLTFSNLKNADTTGAEFAGTTTVGALIPTKSSDVEDSGLGAQPRVHEDVVDEIECNGVDLHTLDYNSGKDLIVTGPCTVNVADTYNFRKINIYNGGSLTFDNTNDKIVFWAYGIIIENDGSLIAGSPENPITSYVDGMTGVNESKLTIFLYGDDQGNEGDGIPCKTDNMCGIPSDIWSSNPTSKVCLPKTMVDPETCTTSSECASGVCDYFYAYKPPPFDQGDDNAYFGYKVIGVAYGGTLKLFGEKGSKFDILDASDSGNSWTRLDCSNDQANCTNGLLDKGKTALTLDTQVDWDIGDKVVVTTTDYLPAHSEVLEITSSDQANKKIGFNVIDPFSGATLGGIQYPHNGLLYPLDLPDRLNISKTNAETRAAVALLSRSIKIASAGSDFNMPLPTQAPPAMSPNPDSYFGGHTMVRQGIKELQIQGVEFYQLGQGARLGHYPLHFHQTRKVPPSTFIRDNSIHDSMTRFITLHGAQGVELSRNVGFMSIGHGYYLEDGTEIDNKLYSNIGILARGALTTPQNPRRVPGILAYEGTVIHPDQLNPSATANFGLGTAAVPYNSDIYNPSVFWIMNGWNDFQYNMAAGANACGVCYWLVPGTNSGPSQGRKWESYASMQTGPVMSEGDNVYEENLGRAAMTPLKNFKGNYCTSAMMSFHVIGATDPCNGVSNFNPIANPNAPIPAAINPPNMAWMGNQNKETFYPKVTGGGGRFPTSCGDDDVTDPLETRNCGPTSVQGKIKDRCNFVSNDKNKGRDYCMVTVLDDYTSSFHWPQVNFAAMWLRPQWYLVTNSFLSDVQNGGLGLVTGGDYTLSNILPGQWQVAAKTVFVGNTQQTNPFASNAGPFNPTSGLTCNTGNANFCNNVNEGISMPLDNFTVNQRFYNIYDGPNYQDSNAYLNIKKTRLDTTYCAPPLTSTSPAAEKCPPSGPNQAGYMYTKIPGIRIDDVDKTTCILPNAAIGWKQPNGFFYPPGFHSLNLYFHDVDIHHYVTEPIWKPGTYVTIEDQVRDEFCSFNNANFSSFSSVDRQTVVNDDDGSQTGLLSSQFAETISVNLDTFFNAPIEATQCRSFDSVKTSPYEYISTVIYPKCASDGNCNGAIWGVNCTNAECSGIPLYRQLLTKADYENESCESGDLLEKNQEIRMAGMALSQRSMMTLSGNSQNTTEDGGKLGAVYYVDTTGSMMSQKNSCGVSPCVQSPICNGDAAGKSCCVATNPGLACTSDAQCNTTPCVSLNVFEPNKTYYTFFLYTKETTVQTYKFYVGKLDRTETNPIDENDPQIVQAVRANIDTSPVKFQPDSGITWNGDSGWKRSYNSGTGILTVTVNMKDIDYMTTKKDFCQPVGAPAGSPKFTEGFCKWDESKKECGCNPNLKGNQKTACENGGADICKRWSGKDIDCPLEGCPGFSLTLPSFFVADDMGSTLMSEDGHRPNPSPFPQVDTWNVELKRANIAGDVGCKDTPIDDPKFCPNPPGAGGGGPPTIPTPMPTTPPVGGGPPTVPFDQDGDGVVDGVDVDSDNDGIPDEMETATNGVNSAVSTRVEIPADPDGDGIPNELDLDSDGDGLPDYYEAGGTNDSNSDGTSDNFVDADNDGFNDAQDADQGGVALPLPDTDGDEVPDFLDKDSDNDSISDTNETSGCVDANDDGILDNSADADNDGLADSVEPGTGTPCVILDTDGDGLPDHLDFNDLTTPGPSQPPVDGDGDDSDTDSGSGGSCAISGPKGVKGGLAGLIPYALIPAAVLIRRKFRMNRKK
jgi:uncharacterized protein YjbI with pentapeptide repeats